MNDRARPWYRTFLIIFAGQAFSLLGSAAVNFALVWWLTATTGSAGILAYASIAALLPQALLGLVVGPFIDRWDRRLTMIAADTFIAATSLVLLALFALGSPSTGVVIGIVALRSVGAAFHTPASQAAVPMYVPAEHLMRVAGWNYFLVSGVSMAGPVLGAFLMGVLPMAGVIALDVGGAAFAVASLLLVRIPHPERSATESPATGLLAEFRQGWRELVHHRGLLQLTLVLVAVTLVYMPLNAFFPLMTLQHFSGDAVRASIAELAFGAGMLAGSAGIGALAARIPGTRLVGIGIFLLGLMAGVSGLLPPSGFWVFAVLCVFMGISAPLFGAPLTALFQGLIDPSKLGRVMSLYMAMTTVVAPVGLLAAGPLAENTGVAPWFALSGALMFLTGLPVWLLPAVRRLDRLVATQQATPQVAVAEGEGQ
ncbi:MAG: MFS transporter [Gaiellales bacterium]|nr:MFS transporter [Gaiellales bacterium]